jgi:aromatic ring-opening dioxygenase catalytic subunit (LigB family)
MSDIHKQITGCFVNHGAGSHALLNRAASHLRLVDAMERVAPSLVAEDGQTLLYSAIVFVSAHWQTHDSFRITAGAVPGYEHGDYGEALKTPPKGDPALASRIADRISDRVGVKCIADKDAALDDVVAGPMIVMFPEVATRELDIPVLAMSINSSLDPKLHASVGAALSSSSQEQEAPILFIGSGMSWHNFDFVRNGHTPEVQSKVQEFNKSLNNTVIGQSGSDGAQGLEQWEDSLPHARWCHRNGDGDHFIPLIVVAGASANAVGKSVDCAMGNGLAVSHFRWERNTDAEATHQDHHQ